MARQSKNKPDLPLQVEWISDQYSGSVLRSLNKSETEQFSAVGDADFLLLFAEHRQVRVARAAAS